MILIILHTVIDREQAQNAIDQAVIKWISRLYVKLTPTEWNSNGEKPQEIWTEAIEAGVLVFSDTQILTGIAVLVSGFIQLPSGLDLYHWEILFHLASFSSLTHLTTMTALRSHFRQRHLMAVVRTICMGFNLVLLAIAVVPIGYTSSHSASPAHAVCLFEVNIPWTRLVQMSKPVLQSSYSTPHYPMSEFNTPFVAFTWALLLTAYATRVVRLFDQPARQARKYLRSWPGSYSARLYTSLRTRRDLARHHTVQKIVSLSLFFFRAAYVLVKAMYDVAESMSFEVSCIELIASETAHVYS
ncbi:MAG: hypothetical protein M1835_007193 [Candelina submexicana]|nr:MAG: hypothetical protein M1835_007193 [Candelina submexicana]